MTAQSLWKTAIYNFVWLVYVCVVCNLLFLFFYVDSKFLFLFCFTFVSLGNMCSLLFASRVVSLVLKICFYFCLLIIFLQLSGRRERERNFGKNSYFIVKDNLSSIWLVTWHLKKGERDLNCYCSFKRITLQINKKTRS